MSTTTKLLTVSPAEELCERYRSEHGFDVNVNEYGNIMLRTGALDGIQMPRELGDRVRELLADNMLRTPIIDNTRTDYLMFLTGAAPIGDDRPVHLHRAVTGDQAQGEVAAVQKVHAGLFRLAAIRTVSGAEITLPGVNDPVRSWLCPPDGVFAEFGRVAELTVAAGAVLRTRHQVPA
ncbi:MAG: hypothetical protein J2P17_01005 [Mycobacterium sp.]|nr:hypothetical protein [Mycobacterium sp.]